LVFEERYSRILDVISLGHPVVVVSPRLRRMSKIHMNTYTIQIVGTSHSNTINSGANTHIGGGEGIVLRKPKSFYEHGRSHSVLKYKTMKDGEAFVLAIRGIYASCRLYTKSPRNHSKNGRRFAPQSGRRGLI